MSLFHLFLRGAGHRDLCHVYVLRGILLFCQAVLCNPSLLLLPQQLWLREREERERNVRRGRSREECFYRPTGLTFWVEYQINVKLEWYLSALAKGASFEHLWDLDSNLFLEFILLLIRVTIAICMWAWLFSYHHGSSLTDFKWSARIPIAALALPTTPTAALSGRSFQGLVFLLGIFKVTVVSTLYTLFI